PIVIDEFTIVGSRCGPFPPALRALSSWISVEALVSARFPLEEGLRAVEAASRPDALKVILLCRT
ncbi:MAG: alcohol dehydrogenase, partial [Deltaproteobacteria bacterium]